MGVVCAASPAAAPLLARSLPLTRRLQAGFELVLILGLLELKLWYLRTINDFAWLLVLGLAVAWVACSSYQRRRTIVQHTAPALRAWAETLGLTLFFGLALAIAGWLLREPYEENRFNLLKESSQALVLFAQRKMVIVIGQQIALYFFLWPVCRDLLGRDLPALCLAAAVFGLLHLPLATLVGSTAVAGMIWIGLYRRHGRALPLIFSHLFLALVMHMAIPERLTGGMTVGAEAAARMKEYRLVYCAETRRRINVLASDEYYARHGGTDQAYLEALYLDVFERPARPRNINYWLKHMPYVKRVELVEYLFLDWEYRMLHEVKTRGLKRPYHALPQ